MLQPAVILDLDGTLIDSRADLATAVNLVRADSGLHSLPVETVTSYIGNGVRMLVKRALPDDTTDLDVAVDHMRTYYAQHLLDQTCLYPGTMEALCRIRDKGYATAVVTNKPERHARTICQALGLSCHLDDIAGGDTCEELKPHPEPLVRAIRQCHASVQGSWMVGDHHTDMAAGRNAGLSRCFCRFGFGDLGNETFELAVNSLDDFAHHLPAPGARPATS